MPSNGVPLAKTPCHAYGQVARSLRTNYQNAAIEAGVYIAMKGFAIDCYVCYNKDGGNDCGEVPDTASLVARGATASGCGSCTKTFSFMGTIWSTVARGCSPSETASCKNIIGHGFCSCTTTFCNGGRISRMHHALLASPIVVLLCLVLL